MSPAAQRQRTVPAGDGGLACPGGPACCGGRVASIGAGSHVAPRVQRCS